VIWWISFGLAYLMVLLGGIRGECSNPYLVVPYILSHAFYSYLRAFACNSYSIGTCIFGIPYFSMR
jgi:hypothetical protein